MKLVQQQKVRQVKQHQLDPTDGLFYILPVVEGKLGDEGKYHVTQVAMFVLHSSSSS